MKTKKSTNKMVPTIMSFSFEHLNIKYNWTALFSTEMYWFLIGVLKCIFLLITTVKYFVSSGSCKAFCRVL